LTEEEKKAREEKILAKKRKNNIKLYPIYKMIAYDWFFYYGINVMYFMQTKNFSSSQAVLMTTIFSIYTILFQPICALVTERIGKRAALILGNIMNLFAIITALIMRGFGWVFLYEAFAALGFGIKYVAESNILLYSIPESKHRMETYTKIEQKGYSRYCVLAAISSIAAGYLFNINPYIPFCACLAFTLLATVLSFSFVDIKEEPAQTMDKEVKAYIKVTRSGFKKALKSNRLKALLLMTSLSWGIICLLQNYQTQLLQFCGNDSVIIGIVFAGIILIKGIGASAATAVNKKFRNKSLTNLLLGFAVVSVGSGLIALTPLPTLAKTILISLMCFFNAIIEGINHVLERRYISSFSSIKVATSISSVKSVTDNISRMIISIIGSAYLTFTDIRYAFLLMGATTLLLILFASTYAKTRLGKKPEEYTKRDIYQ